MVALASVSCPLVYFHVLSGVMTFLCQEMAGVSYPVLRQGFCFFLFFLTVGYLVGSKMVHMDLK